MLWLLCRCVFTISLPNKQKEKGSRQETSWQPRGTGRGVRKGIWWEGFKTLVPSSNLYSKTSNNYIAGNGSVLKVYMFIKWLNRFAKLVNVNSFFCCFLLLLQWPPLIVITLVQPKSDNNNWQITIGRWTNFSKKQDLLGLVLRTM